MTMHGVLFDIGYGLCDESQRLASACERLSALLREVGRHHSPQELDTAYRGVCADPPLGRVSLLEQVLLVLGLEPEPAKHVRRKLAWDAEPLTLLPGAIDALRALRAAGLRVGVLANQPASAADDLQRLGVTPLLDGFWLSETVGLHKPDPKFFQLALDAWNLPPGRVAYIGDRPDNDIAPAKRLGLHTVRLLVGPHAEQPAKSEDERADFEAVSLAEAANYLVQWMMDDG